jgi:hypothetical protein
LARVAALVALFGFFMPWATVSCSNQQLATMSGAGLAVGRFVVQNPMTGAAEAQQVSPVTAIVIAMILVVCGLGFSFLRAKREAFGALLIASVVAFAASAMGMSAVTSPSARQRVVAENSQYEASMASMTRIDLRYGFWVTLLALTATAGLSFVAMVTVVGAMREGPQEGTQENQG